MTGVNRVAQFLAVCSSSILAEALCLSSPFSGQSREKRGVSEKRLSLLLDSFQPSTNSEKLSNPTLVILSFEALIFP
jgi:hypothetical protein